ncbi:MULTISPECIES: sodium:proton antiporter NhaD [unclassified Olleya]|jgi:Na+/H+ antiporter NhaD/arsenite permease-like protein|uniref:sodium:proton antiporter NhaD n=1 Tax=unclassified Olleya TaxID=2615019 RepID=UPI0011A26AC7|nr:sodium:proton antiporter NhaD [Olleya sp. Hel_I_94]TVZ50150.1 Na+/H+ antiporter NhaD/arsenite permease-like protein [Olleya sp. Hel_I_94]|tara:strand:- start:87107 stop:88501 length:1395 start_codon:yes stop_codon:yes gene_type:complete
MESVIILVFVIGYLAITLEHNIKIDKLIPALVMMAISWALISLGLDSFTEWFDSANHGLVEGYASLGHETKMHLMEETLLHHLGKTAEILVFLLGAMTIVEIIDYFDGFSTIKSFIKTKKKTKILWIFAFLAFILSAIIDNLTATIVLISILQKIVNDRNVRIWFAGLIIIAANAGGAWSPIGDVTTTMLWIGKKVTTGHLVGYLLLPSLICMLVPTFIASFLPAFKGDLAVEEVVEEKPKSRFSGTMLYLGLGAIVFVPIFKTVTHLPPYVGMMLALGVVAIFAEIYSSAKFSLSNHDSEESDAHAHHSPVHHSLSKIELPSILFFLGILMAVAALESLGILFGFASTLQDSMPMMGTELHHEGVSDLVIILLGIGSAVIDNVPLVAASLGMFSQPIDNELWHFIAYSAGTGGSMLIIGSAAGVVAMGMEKIDFFWYFKKISWLALAGFLAGTLVFFWTRTLF